jgi:serine protease Do
MNDIFKKMGVETAFLGCDYERLSPEISIDKGIGISYGRLVNDIAVDSPAMKCGLKVGDVIVEFNGQKIDYDVHFGELFGNSPININIPIKVVRDGQEIIFSVILEEYINWWYRGLMQFIKDNYH